MKALLKIGIAILATQMICGVVQAQTVLPMHMQPDGRIMVNVRINGKPVSALLDTGADIVVVTKAVKMSSDFHASEVSDFQGSGSVVLEGNVEICLSDAKSSCIDIDGVQNRAALNNILPITVLEQFGSKVEFDFKAKTLTIE